MHLRRRFRAWQINFRDHRGRRRSIPGFTDKAATVELGTRIEHLVACRAVGKRLDPELARWVESLSPSILTRLIEIGLVEEHTLASARPLATHIADFRDHLQAGSRSSAYIAQTVREINDVCEGSKFRFLSDIAVVPVEQYLASRRRGDQGVSIRTSNSLLKAIKSFVNWTVQEHRLSANPLSGMECLNADVDRRRQRRALSAEEVQVLLAYVRIMPIHHGMPGHERALLYALALRTGLRVNELRSLTAASFNLDAGTVTVAAVNSKHRREDILPLPPEIMDDLRQHLALKIRGAAAFNMQTLYTCAMLQKDMATARAAWIQEGKTPEERISRDKSEFLVHDGSRGVVDFHALRHSFISALAMVAPLKATQGLARHADPRLTLNVYSHVTDESQVAALAKLPSLGRPTGTGD